MVHLFSRLTRLLARVSNSPIIPTETPLQTENPLATPDEAFLQAITEQLDPIVAESRELNNDVDAWIESLQLSTLEHERVQVGNRAYAYAMKVSAKSLVVGS
jgi:hypothetical protein